MVLARYQQNVDKCTIAEFVLQIPCCPNPDDCDFARCPEVVAQIYQHFNLLASPVLSSISPQALQDELLAGRPVEVGVGGCPGAAASKGHLMVVYGWVTGTTFLVHDPLEAGTGPVDYQWLLTDRGCWRETWTNLQPAAPAREVLHGHHASTDTVADRIG
jgi:hypothetical protein